MAHTILTQHQLRAALRDELGLHVGPPRIHRWIREGMPVAPTGGKKPRFVWNNVKAWLLGQPEVSRPVAQKVRDQVFRAGLRQGA